jgi:hypothetical protein
LTPFLAGRLRIIFPKPHCHRYCRIFDCNTVAAKFGLREITLLLMSLIMLF